MRPTLPFAVLLLALLHCSLYSAPSFAVEPTLDQQRKLYAQVKLSLERGGTRLFDQHKKQLHSYPLFPYLEYTRLSRHLTLKKRSEVDEFLRNYPASRLSKRLRNSWLNLLYRKKLWQLYQDYYLASASTTEMSCRYHFARYQSGDTKAALDDGLKLWIVGKSQPKACDPLFRLLISEQRITNQIAWQRYSAAVLQHNYQLGRYIERFFTTDKYRTLAKRFVSVDRNPRRIDHGKSFDSKIAEFESVIEHAIRHLSNKNAPLALQHWAHYQQTHVFTERSQSKVLASLVKNLYHQNYDRVAAAYLRDRIDLASDDLLEWQLRKSLLKADWSAIVEWVALLPEELREHQRWRYWQARALLMQSTEVADIDAAKTTLRELSRFRSFYGFLASDWVSNPYRLQHQAVDVTAQAISNMEATPAIQRTRELLYHKEKLSARREWYDAGLGFDSEQWQTAAVIAQKWQWHGQVILAMARAQYWNDIDLRFPMVFHDEFKHHAREQKLPLPLVLAIARQESMLRPDVTSPAGARGLMQLMPATAREVARKHKIRYRGPAQLFEPELNIHLGSRYYRNVLKNFNDNRILATAAYNAGPRRVKSWLKKSDGQIPFDAWIETIPFNETRQYVQNVLSFSVIYAHHLNLDEPILKEKERSTLL